MSQTGVSTTRCEQEAIRVAVFSQLWPEAVRRLKQRYDCRVAVNPEPDEKRRLIAETDVAILRSPVVLDRETLEVAARLKLVVRAGMGLDTIDRACAGRRGVQLVAVPLSAESVAEHIFGLLFSLYRKIPWFDRSLRQRRWEKHTGYGREVFGKSLGLLGFGRIGIRTAEIAKVFNMPLMAYDRSPSKPAKREAAQRLGVRFVDLEELFAAADVISVQLPLNDGTRRLVDARLIGIMKRDAVLVNVGRGKTVDCDALGRALRSGRIAGAALDVFATEPPGEHPLLGLDNFVGTPHVGAQTVEAQQRVGDDVLKVIEAFRTGQDLRQFGVLV